MGNNVDSLQGQNQQWNAMSPQERQNWVTAMNTAGPELFPNWDNSLNTMGNWEQLWGTTTPAQQQPVQRQQPGTAYGGRYSWGNQQPSGYWESVPQDYNTMSEWQQWQLSNRPLNPTSELTTPEDFELSWLEGGEDPGGRWVETGPTWQPEPLGPVYQPIRKGGVMIPGGDYGGGQDWTYDPDPSTPGDQYTTLPPDTITQDPIGTLPTDPVTNEPIPPQEQIPQQDVYGIINQYYQDILGRNVGQPGYDFYSGELRGGLGEDALRDALYYSPENLAQDPDYGWLQGAYQQYLGRDIDPAGRNFYLGDINDIADINREQIARDLAGSPEGREYANRDAGQGPQIYALFYNAYVSEVGEENATEEGFQQWMAARQ